MSNGTLNGALVEIQHAALILRGAMAKQFSCKEAIDALGKLAAELQEQNAELTIKFGEANGASILNKVGLNMQKTRADELKTNAEQALSFIGQIMNHTEDSHVAHFVDMAEQWLSKGFAPVIVADFQPEKTEFEQVVVRLRRFSDPLLGVAVGGLSTWVPVSEQPPNGVPLFCYHHDWIDADFNPKGVREGFYNPNEESDDWTTAKWNNDQDRYMTFYDVPSHWMLPEPPEMGEQEDTPQWQTVEQFEKSGYQGRCWIRYKGRPVICTYTGERYTFSRGSGVYMSECISGVIPIPTPSAEAE